jgi:putative ABC transport system substrate-binding protein
MNRRKFTALLAAASLARPALAHAQETQKAPLIGFLHPGFPDSGSPTLDALREGLRDAGYVEGETVKVDARWGRGKPEVLPQLAKELIQLRAAVLVATARPSIEAARAATTELPIVADDLESDPVASGYVQSLAHPGGNLTGLFLDAPTLCGKWLQQIGGIVPNVTKIAALWDATTGTYQLDAIKAAVNGEVDRSSRHGVSRQRGTRDGARIGAEARTASCHPAWLSADPSGRAPCRRNLVDASYPWNIAISNLP